MISRWNLFGQRVEFVARGPIAALAENFDQHAGRLQPGHPGQIDRALGVAGPPQHAPLLGHQRVKMPGTNEIGRLRLRVEDFDDRPCPLRRRHARATRTMIHRHGEGRLKRRRIVLDDRRQIEPVGRFGQDRHTKLPAAVSNHEIDDFRRHLFGCADEIALVFAVLGVHHDDDLARGDGLDGRFDARQTMRHGNLL